MPKIDRINVSKRHARRLRNAVVQKLLLGDDENLSIPSDSTTNEKYSPSNCTAEVSNSENYYTNTFHVTDSTTDEPSNSTADNDKFMPNNSLSPPGSSTEYSASSKHLENEASSDDTCVNDDYVSDTSLSLPDSLEKYYSDGTDDSATANTENANPGTENDSDSDIELCSLDESIFDANSDVDDTESYSYSLDPSTFRNDLNNVLLKNNATQTLTTDLLKLLRPILPFLPTDARTLLKTPRNTKTIRLQNGEMRYFGIVPCLERELEGCVLGEDEVIQLDFNIDGLPLFKSSSTEFWPILGRVSNIDDQKPFAVAIFCGQGKPDPIDQYLEQFIDEIEFLLENGIILKSRSYAIKIRCFSCDAPARSWLKSVKAHSAIAGCERCRALATSQKGRLFYPNKYVFRPRKDQDFHDPKQNCDRNQSQKCTAKQKRKLQKKHILGKSPLLRISNLGLVTQFVIDSMHLVFLGVMKRLLLKYWIGGKRPFKLLRRHFKIADEIIRAIRPFIPSDFARKSRSFIEIKRWKATEFRLFLLYTGPIILKEVLNRKKYNHFILLHAAITILCRSNQSDERLEFARSVLVKFVKRSAKLYEKEFIVYNVHSLPHIVDDVKNYGPLDTHSCFPFENYLKTLKMRVRSKRQPLQQISNRISELDALQKIKKADPLQVKPTGIQCTAGQGNMEEYFECSSVQYRGLRLSAKTPDNVVSINSNIHLIEKICCIYGEYKLIASPFKFKDNLYNKPLRSSTLDIFYVKNLGHLSTFSLDSVSHKCCRFPFKEGFAIFPIIHHTS